MCNLSEKNDTVCKGSKLLDNIVASRSMLCITLNECESGCTVFDGWMLTEWNTPQQCAWQKEKKKCKHYW